MLSKMGNGPLFHKPKSFLTARQVLYTCIFLSVLQFLLSEFNVGLAKSGGVPAAGIVVAYSAIALWLIKEMSICLKWARTVLAAVLILTMIVYPLIVFQELKTNLLQIALLVIQYALQVYAIFLLYKEECTAWFNSITHNEMLP